MAKAGRIQHWKHGWIPLTAAARAYAAGVGPKPSPLSFPEYDDLSPSLRGKIGAKLESLTGIPEPELAKRVQANLVRLYQTGDKAEADWYSEEGGRIASRAADIRAAYPGFKLTSEQLTGMIAVTSAKKRWKENVDFADAIARKLAADQPFPVTDEMIGDFNAWAAKRRGGAEGTAIPHPDMKPGTYRPSELPADFVASKTPGMPKHLNADYVIRATQIARGEKTLDEIIQGPKQRSFVDNLLVPEDDRFVTVDTWHYRAAMKGIPITKTVGKGEDARTYSYTLEQWSDRELTVSDGRAAARGYDPRKARYDPANLEATIDAADSMTPQTFFQGGPASKADNWKGSWGTYPWFVKQTQLAADQLGVSPNAVQAVAWYNVGGGA